MMGNNRRFLTKTISLPQSPQSRRLILLVLMSPDILHNDLLGFFNA